MSAQAGWESQCAVVCIDGITNAVIRGFTPDVSWADYVAWLGRRRPSLHVIHLRQPHDWGELILGRPDQHEQLLGEMVEQALSQYDTRIRYIVLLGFSLGGLRAIHVARRVAELRPDLSVEYLAYVTFGTPFKATGRLTDIVLKRLRYDYFKHMLDADRTRDGFRQLALAAGSTRIRILIGEIEHDEIVSASSSLAPVHWLTAMETPAALKWGTFLIHSSSILRAHDGLLHDPVAIGYIDGLLDGLLPADGSGAPYEPFSS